VRPTPITININRKYRGRIDGRMLAGIAAAILLIIVGIYALYPEPEPEPVPAPMPTRPLETVAPAESEEQRGDTAREIIDTLKAAPDNVDYAEGYARALEFQAAGRLADAQLLYFFAARGGYAPAAFSLATFYDPNHHSQESSLMDEADPFQAYKWYRQAEDAGHEDAAVRLEELHAWAEDAAQAGDSEAERLLLQWE